MLGKKAEVRKSKGTALEKLRASLWKHCEIRSAAEIGKVQVTCLLLK